MSDLKDRVFSGIFCTGIGWADRTVEKGGDYKRLAFLYFKTLELEIEKDCPANLREYIVAEAAKVQSRKGEQFQISTAGQTITLGWGLTDATCGAA